MPSHEISVSELAGVQAAVVIDVREPDEYVSGHIPGAINIPLSTVPDNIQKMTIAPVVHLVCQAGGRSGRACDFLESQDEASGTTFINVAGGTSGWILEGNDVVTGEQPS